MSSLGDVPLSFSVGGHFSYAGWRQWSCMVDAGRWLPLERWFRWDPSLDQLRVRRARVLHYLQAGPRVRPEVEEAVGEAGAAVRRLSQPRGGLARCALRTVEEGWVSLDGGDPFPLEDGYREGARQAVVLLATLGEGIQRESTLRFKRGEYLESLALDAVGSALVDELAAHLYRQAGALVAAEGLVPGYLLSPGCPQLLPEVQANLMREVPAQELGVYLNDSGYLVPTKSLCALVPLLEGGRRRGSRAACGRCPQRERCFPPAEARS